MITATYSRHTPRQALLWLRKNCLYWLGIFDMLLFEHYPKAEVYYSSFCQILGFFLLQLVWRVWTMFARLVKCSHLPSRIRQPSVCPTWSRTFSQLKCKQIIPYWNTTTIRCSYQLFCCLHADVYNHFIFLKKKYIYILCCSHPPSSPWEILCPSQRVKAGQTNCCKARERCGDAGWVWTRTGTPCVNCGAGVTAFLM